MATQTMTAYSEALSCMDAQLASNHVTGLVIISPGIYDATGKVQAGTKEMIATAVSSMAARSRAITYIDYDTSSSDLMAMNSNVDTSGWAATPPVYIRGAVTSFDENILSTQYGGTVTFEKRHYLMGKGGEVSGIEALDLSTNRQKSYSSLSIDMNSVMARNREVIAGGGASNTILIEKETRGDESGGLLAKAGVNLTNTSSRSEGIGTATRALVEIGLVEVLGKLAHVPWWSCLGMDMADPKSRHHVLEMFENMEIPDRVLVLQRHLARYGYYQGTINGLPSHETIESVVAFQKANDMPVTGYMDFRLYQKMLGGQVVHKAQAAEAAPSESLRLSLTTEKNSETVYALGDTLHVSVAVTADAYVHCYYQSADQHIFRIFPSRWQPDAMVRANGTTVIPPRDRPGLRIVLDSPGAAETVTCFSSRHVLDDGASPAKETDTRPIQLTGMADVATSLGKGGRNDLVQASVTVRVK
ncbi:MAG: DUF4384 domain-containing protein [Alphaproteobacteria bacterium]